MTALEWKVGCPLTDHACVLLRWQLSGPKVQPPVIWEWDQEHQEHVMDLQPVVEKDQPDYL